LCQGLSSQKWVFQPDGSIAWQTNSKFCLGLQPGGSDMPVTIAKCDPNDLTQKWSYNIYTLQLINNLTASCLSVVDGTQCGSLGLDVCDVDDLNHQLWFYDSTDGYIMSFTSSMCIDGGIVIN